MSLHPHGTVPEGLRTPRVMLRPLLAADVERDYDAVMSDPAALRRWSQSDWPDDEFTLAENLTDLERHEREHKDGVAFTFTVLSPDGSRFVIGASKRATEEVWALDNVLSAIK